MNLTPGVELAILLFFGVCAGLYLVGRGRSFLLQYHEVVARIEAKKLAEDSKDLKEEKDAESSMDQ